jgi:hypothetical protein
MKPQPNLRPTSVPSILMRAAEIMNERGMVEGQYWNLAGAVCLEGAIITAAGEDWDERWQAILAASVYAVEVWSTGDLPYINDELLQSKEDGVAFLRNAAFHSMELVS